MAELEKVVLVVDIDKTICSKKTSEQTYSEVTPYTGIIDIINDLHSNGAEIIYETARNMLTQKNDESKVIQNVGLTTLQWLKDNNVEYDGLKFGKTCGTCYIDDKALRPGEFVKIYNSLKDKTDVKELEKKIEEYLKENG